MKRVALAVALFASVAIFVPSALAYSSPGTPDGYVNDFAKVLSSETKQSLENELVNFEQQTSSEITVTIVPSMGGDYVEHYAVKLFEEWGVGKKDKDNGVLLLLSIEERKMRIEVGYGLEGALPDSVAQSILNNEMTPRLKAGDYDGAVSAGVRAIEEATRGEYTASQNSHEASFQDSATTFLVIGLFISQFLSAILARSRSWWAGGIVGFLGATGIGWFFALSALFAVPLVVLLTLLGLLFDYVVSTGYQNAKAQGVTPPWWIGGSGRSGSSGGGFGGFGGGSSGGGGASGRW